MTIRNKMIFSIICFVIVPMFFIPMLMFSNYKGIVEDKINRSTQQTLAQVANNMGTVFDNMISASNMLCFDSELIDSLRRYKGSSTWERYLFQTRIETKITNVQNATLYPYNSDIVMIDFKGDIFSSSSYHSTVNYSRLSQEDWFKKTIAMNGYMLWMAPLGDYLNPEGDDRKKIAMARLIKDPSNGNSYGIILISLYPEMRLESPYKAGAQWGGSQLLLLNNQGKIILGNEPALVGTTYQHWRVLLPFLKQTSGDNSFVLKIAGQKTVGNYYLLSKTDWKIVQLIPYKVLMRDIDRLRSYQITINLLFLAALILVTVFISWTITTPLHRLSLLMRQVPKGDFSLRADIKGRDEVAELGNDFNIMVREMEQLIKQLQEAQALREKSRLEALQAQINPHFLFNTLNDIKWLASINRAGNVSQMIAALGKLLETTLGKNEELITLTEEISCIKSYILLAKMRYGDRFEVVYEIDPELLNCRIPYLLLQPLVENAIIHGFEDMESDGLIRIRGYRQQENLLIEVADNGKGIDSDRLKILLTMPNPQSGRFSNIGIKNVSERIVLYYGREYGLTVESKEGSGTSIRLLLPCRWGGEASA